MNWLVFALALWLLRGLELGLAPLLSPGQTQIAPSLVTPLLVLVALWAPGSVTRWSALLIGVTLDLTSGVMLEETGTATILGPYTLGCLLAAQLVLASRGVVIGRSPMTMVVLSVGAALVMHIVAAALLTVRGLYDPIVWDASRELGVRFFSSIYTGVLALPMTIVLAPLTPALRFHSPPASARFARRH